MSIHSIYDINAPKPDTDLAQDAVQFNIRNNFVRILSYAMWSDFFRSLNNFSYERSLHTVWPPLTVYPPMGDWLNRINYVFGGEAVFLIRWKLLRIISCACPYHAGGNGGVRARLNPNLSSGGITRLTPHLGPGNGLFVMSSIRRFRRHKRQSLRRRPASCPPTRTRDTEMFSRVVLSFLRADSS